MCKNYFLNILCLHFEYDFLFEFSAFIGVSWSVHQYLDLDIFNAMLWHVEVFRHVSIFVTASGVSMGLVGDVPKVLGESCIQLPTRFPNVEFTTLSA